MQNILTFVTAHWAAIVGSFAAAHTLAMSVANFFPTSKAATVIETVYDYTAKVLGFVQPFVTRNSQSDAAPAPTTPASK